MGRASSSNGGSAAEQLCDGAWGEEGEAKVCDGDLVTVPVQVVDGCFKERIVARYLAARCSFNQLYDVIQRFDGRKRRLVEEVGFGGLLHFPAIRQLDRRFMLWLMCRVDPFAKSIVIEDDVKIKFDKGDVAHVFGIPCGGMKVPASCRSHKEVVNLVMRDVIGIKDFKNRSIKLLQEVLDRDYGHFMTPENCVAFKVAFVIYVVSTMLCPGCRWDYAYVDYWDAIVDHSRIGAYDWCDYVIRKLLDAVVKIKIDMESANKNPNITGCSLFLQVAVGVYKYVSGVERDVRLKFVSVVASVMECHAGGVNGRKNGGCRCEGGTLSGGAGCEMGKSGKGKRVVCECDGLDVKRVRWNDGSCGSALVDGRGKGHGQVALVDGQSGSGGEIVEFEDVVRFMDPWSVGYKCIGSYDEIVQFIKDNPLGGICGRRDCPSLCAKQPVEAKAAAVWRQLSGDVDLDTCTVDAVISALKERDGRLYSRRGEVRWRHVVHPSFMAMVLAGRLSPGDVVAAKNFDFQNLGYHVSLCRMIFMPAVVSCRWVCYAWMRDDDVIIVFDPLAPTDGGHDVNRFHQNACGLIREALGGIGVMRRCCCHNGPKTMSFQMLQPAGRAAWRNRSGVGCVLFCSMFDGQGMRGMLDQNDLGVAAAAVLYDALSMASHREGHG
ncbi:unnamed protein product [Urochloa decumbens]|uniref:Uncharacterized protein n=1 Tax=Urochloa decumbens TaxID=240449 RepID=A0ABC9GTG7_9POAL